MNSEELQQIAHELKTQDNLATQEPLFCVFQKLKIYGIDPDYHTNIKSEEGADGDVLLYVEVDSFVNAHFTRKAAQKYIDSNKHNLRKPFVFVISLYRCDEMIEIRHFLLNEASFEQEAPGKAIRKHALMDALKEAILEYHHALDIRQHGGVAQAKCIHKIQDILGMPWKQGATLRVKNLK